MELPEFWSALEVLVLVASTIVVFYGLYRLIRWLVPGWGTILTNVIMGGTVLVEALQGVPWTHVLTPAQTSYVTFTLFIVNMLMRLTIPSETAPMPKLLGTTLEIKK